MKLLINNCNKFQQMKSLLVFFALFLFLLSCKYDGPILIDDTVLPIDTIDTFSAFIGKYQGDCVGIEYNFDFETSIGSYDTSFSSSVEMEILSISAESVKTNYLQYGGSYNQAGDDTLYYYFNGSGLLHYYLTLIQSEKKVIQRRYYIHPSGPGYDDSVCVFTKQ